MKGIKRELSIPRTPQQNGIAERKNRTLIEAARTMLVDSLLPILFWAETVNTACYVQNRVLVTKPQNKTHYELLLGRTPTIGFMRHFGCPVTILNTLDPLGKFDGKADEGFLVGYSNTNDDAAFRGKKHEFEEEKPESEVHVSPSSSAQTKKHDDKTKKKAKGKSPVELSTGYRNLSAEFEDFFDNSINKDNADDSQVHADGNSSYVDTLQYPDDLDMPKLEDITYSDDQKDVGAEADFTNLETTITVSHIPTTRVHKDHPVTQIIGFEDPDYPNKVYKVVKALYGLHQAPRAWYETLANYLLENGFQMGKIDQTLFIKSQDKYVAEILWKLGLTDEKLASTPIDTKKPLLKDPDGEDVDVHTYRSMIGSLMYLTSSRPDITFTSNDVTRLQALVDKKKVVVTEAAIRDTLCLDDAEGVDCLPNDEIFTELARIVAREPKEQGDAEEQGTNDNAAEETDTDVSKDDVENQSIPSPTPPTPPPQQPQDIPSTSQAQSPPPQPQSPTLTQLQGAHFLMSLLQEALEGCAALARRVEHLEHDKVAQDLEIIKIKTRVKKLERANKVKALKLRRLRKVGTSQRVDTSDDTIMEDVSNQGRMINELDRDEGAVLMNEKEEKKAKEVKDITGDAQVKGSEVVTTAKLITEVVAAVSEIVSAAAVAPTVTAVNAAAVAPTLTAAPVKVVVPSTRRRRGVIIRDPKEESSAQTPIEIKFKNKRKIKLVEPRRKLDV
nr:ribonuclease H-like domain-containing protein [Tanacetum cinerariifolium]